MAMLLLVTMALKVLAEKDKRQTGPQEIKHGAVMKLCGYQIYMAFQYCCTAGCGGRKKRELSSK